MQHSRKRDVEGCGPDSTVGTLFPRAVGAALGRLVDLLGAHLSDAQKVSRMHREAAQVDGCSQAAFAGNPTGRGPR